MGSSPSREDGLTSSNSEQEREIRMWSQFELDTVCALICKHEQSTTSKTKFKRRPYPRGAGGDGKDLDSHVRDWALGFATKLNEALHGAREYKHDIPVTDVRELMDFIEKNNDAIMEYICRQSAPFRITRAKKYVFQRLCNDFNNALCKWTVSRRERRRNPDATIGEELSRLSSAVPNLPSSTKENRFLGVTPIPPPGPKTYSGQRPVPPPKQYRLSHRQRRRRIPYIPPPPPLLSPLPSLEQPDAQQFESHYRVRYEDTEAEKCIHPVGSAFDGYLDPTLSAVHHPPASSNFVDHDDLRQSIHPTGPKPATPLALASPTYRCHPRSQQISQPMGEQFDASGILTSPAYSKLFDPASACYHYPEPTQESRNFDYSRFLETPTLPPPPVHNSHTTSARMLGTETEPVQTICTLEAGSLSPSSGGYSEHYSSYYS
ncbi:hypothetical protein NUW58_g2824 [Xylaria curta]|uniref:Uncharacterized protein n=1 Tax=Xylaria curta TaxID=42375 RepID=A0ACC1PGG4_9PEZI|nr:hypothetical protein NUW58_g2824 [Xylaria curta]